MCGPSLGLTNCIVKVCPIEVIIFNDAVAKYRDNN